MARRTVYGNTTSENGWPMVDQGSCTWVDIPGTTVRLQIQDGQPLAILRAFAADFHAHVEPLRDADSACWTPTNSVPSSNHLSGTGMDLNWQGPDGKTFRLGIPEAVAYPGDKARKLRELLDFYENIIFCGGEWSIRDWMHFQLNGNTYRSQATADFIARKIRADGYSTFRRGNSSTPTPADPVRVLADATGIPLSRAQNILPQVRDGLTASSCTTARRIAYWLAQIGHESDSFRATQEYQSGDESTDRWKYKGRTWIQITWQSNYAGFSRWCHQRGLVPTADYFVARPRELADQKWAGLGPAWYWTVARPQINALCDAGDFVGVTRAINGGTNGMTDRQARLTLAQALGDQLLTLVSDTATSQEDTTVTLESISLYATPGETTRYTLHQMVQSIDGMTHRALIESAAELGDRDALDRIARVAAGAGKYRDPAAIAHARAVLTDIESRRPEILADYLKG